MQLLYCCKPLSVTACHLSYHGGSCSAALLAAGAYLPRPTGFLGAAAAAAAVLTALGLRLALNRSSAFLSRSSRACSSLQRNAVQCIVNTASTLLQTYCIAAYAQVCVQQGSVKDCRTPDCRKHAAKCSTHMSRWGPQCMPGTGTRLS
jgi:hypothetical protein